MVMKVRICYTIDVSDDYRRALRQYYGETGLATREEVVSFKRLHGDSCDNDLMSEAQEDQEDMEVSYG